MLCGDEHVATIFCPGRDAKGRTWALWYAPNMLPDGGRADDRDDALNQIREHLGFPPATEK